MHRDPMDFDHHILEEFLHTTHGLAAPALEDQHEGRAHHQRVMQNPEQVDVV
jgi:hypothetical protein